MSIREGNLEAPTRHPLDWKNPVFYDKDACLTEMERVFDICHGCRRCVSLCQSFPNLFDLVDATEDGEVHGVKKEAYWKVVDQCYLCYMTKCPYTLPHPWQLDFPHLMLRAKAIKYSAGLVGEGEGEGEKFLAATDLHGSFAGIPIVAKAVNAVNKTKLARGEMDSLLGVHPDAWMPSLAEHRFRWNVAKTDAATPVTKGQRTPGKVTIFATCYVKFALPTDWTDPLMTTPTHTAITLNSLLSLEAYSKIRKTSKPDVIAHRRLRSVRLGEHLSLQFEDEQTIRRQIQEMLLIEKIFEEAGILAEIEVYAPLVPDGTNWKATMLIEYPDPNERKRELARLIGVEDRMFVEVEGHARVYAIADEDLDRENDEKTSAVHFVRFEFTPAAREAVRAGAAVKLGCSHAHYPAHVAISPETLASLAGDLT